MPPSLPSGEPAPAHGDLPAGALAGFGSRPFGIYLHVPYCRVRCGYCDFNTYALPELADQPTAGPQQFLEAALAELELAARVLSGPGAGAGSAPPVDTVFFGGGTPTVLPAEALARLLGAVRRHWGLSDGVEVTTEANPDTVTPQLAEALAQAGFTRVSLGMQSAVAPVLAVLERTHEPAAVARAVAAVRDAGLAVSLDLIYGAPGETPAEWAETLDAAIGLQPQHVSAYALVVEEGTRLAARVRRGELAAPDDDDLAAKYELADTRLAAAGYTWYEVSNWARAAEHACRHNLGYWRGADWWGVGPGAHSHVGGVRWWNVKHPSAYAARLAAGRSPAAGRELLTPAQRADEQVLLGVRLAEGLPLAQLSAPARTVVAGLVADGLVDGPAALGASGPRRIVLTRRGRLLADAVVRRLVI